MTKYFDFDLKENYGIQICTSTTRPTAYEGRHIYETNTNKILVCTNATGPVWEEIGGGWVGTATSDLNMSSYNIYGTAGYKIYLNGDGGGTYLKDDASGNMEFHVATGKKIKIVVG